MLLISSRDEELMLELYWYPKKIFCNVCLSVIQWLNHLNRKEKGKIIQRPFEPFYAASSSILICLDLRLLIFASLVKNCFAFNVCGIGSTTGDKTENYSAKPSVRSSKTTYLQDLSHSFWQQTQERGPGNEVER